MHELVVYVAKYLIIVSVLLVLFVGWRLPTWRQRWQFALLIVLGGIISLALAKLVGHFWYNPRPFVVEHFTPWIAHANDNGFPSDHTLLAAFLGYVLLRYSKVLGIVGLILGAGIGAARVAAGVHHAVDVIGSFVIAGVGTLLALGIICWAIHCHTKVRLQSDKQ